MNPIIKWERPQLTVNCVDIYCHNLQHIIDGKQTALSKCGALEHIQKKKPHTLRPAEIYWGTSESHRIPICHHMKFVLVLWRKLITSTSKDTSRTVRAEPLTDFSYMQIFHFVWWSTFSCIWGKLTRKDALCYKVQSLKHFAECLIFSENNQLSLNTMQMYYHISISHWSSYYNSLHKHNKTIL